MASGDTKTEQMLNVLANGGDASQFSGCCNTKTQNYILGAIDRVQSVEDEVEELKNNPDVVDIVDTYADLQAYDTQHLTENDIIRVLQDETHSGNSTYYRFTKNPDTWTFIGEISGGGVTPVQTTGTSTTDVMSQNAASSMVFADPGTDSKIKIGYNTTTDSNNSIAIGSGAQADGSSSFRSTVIGYNASSQNQDAVALGASSSISGTGNFGVAIGRGATCGYKDAVALGAYSNVSYAGEVNIGSTDPTHGYNSSNYRLISGVYDGQTDHDAVNLSQLNGRVKQNAGAPTTATVGTVGQLLEDTTNGKLYQCTAVDTTDPNNPNYTWAEVGAGGGGPTVVQATGTSTTDVMSQNATTSMVFADPATQRKVKIGANTFNPVGDDAVEIGKESKAKGLSTVAIGSGATVDSFANQGVAIGCDSSVFGDTPVAIGYLAATNKEKAVALGRSAHAYHSFAVALGAGATTSVAGEINVGTGSSYPTKGYNGTNYRLISGVHDGQSAHDAVTVSQVNATIDAINTALSTNIPHIGAAS